PGDLPPAQVAARRVPPQVAREPAPRRRDLGGELLDGVERDAALLRDVLGREPRVLREEHLEEAIERARSPRVVDGEELLPVRPARKKSRSKLPRRRRARA